MWFLILVFLTVLLFDVRRQVIHYRAEKLRAEKQREDAETIQTLKKHLIEASEKLRDAQKKPVTIREVRVPEIGTDARIRILENQKQQDLVTIRSLNTQLETFGKLLEGALAELKNKDSELESLREFRASHPSHATEIQVLRAQLSTQRSPQALISELLKVQWLRVPHARLEQAIQNLGVIKEVAEVESERRKHQKNSGEKS